MTDVKHTPGPWVIIPAIPFDDDELDRDGAFCTPAGIEGSNGDPVCLFGDPSGSGTLFENEADYHLIAAAPDLLAAAKRALNFIENTEGEIGCSLESGELLRAAIAKAEGRS